MRIKQTHKNPPDKQPLSGDSLRGQFHLLSTGCYPRQQNTADTTSPIAANHTQQMNSVEKNWFVDPPNPLLCSILPPYTVGHKPSRNWECSTVCFFCFPQIGPLCSHKSTNSSYPNSLLVWPVSCVSVSWSKRQGERDGEENQTRYHSDASYHSSRHRLFFSLPLLDFQCTPCDGCAASSIVTAAYQTVTQQEVLSHRELACFSTGNYSENLKSKLLCPQSQLLVYKNYYFLTGSVPHLQDESMAESNNYILFS